MKMVKSLLLGSAAGLVAVVGAQAADLPVKAKPVEYVKVCSLYGAGFWYVPGTDTCLKIGSYIRVQSEYGAGNGGIPIGMADGATGGRFTRTDTSDYAFRVRASLSVDLRTQTEYGTLRSYLEVGQQWTTATNAAAGANAPGGDLPFIDRAFIQFAGLTAGRIRSFFDINSFAPYGYSNVRFSADTGANGIYGIGYTAQLGNGVSATLSIEDPGLATGGRGRTTVNLDTQVWAPVTAVVTDNKGTTFPDVVGNLRIDQAWGYAAISAAAHDNSGGYYSGNGLPFAGAAGTTLAAFPGAGLTTANSPIGGAANSGLANASFCGVGVASQGVSAASGVANNTVGPICDLNGHPSDKWGYAGTVGFTLKNVLGLAGDEFGVQAAYGSGAGGYTGKWGTYTKYKSDNSVGLGYYADSTFATGTGISLTQTWSVNAFYQHIWNPNWKTSLYGGYEATEYPGAAKANICGALTPTGFNVNGATGASAPAVASGQIVNPAFPLPLAGPPNGAGRPIVGSGFFPGTVSNCDPDFSVFQVGTRTQWNPHPDLDIGLDLLWTHLNTAYKGTAVLGPSGARPGGLYTIEDQEVYSAMVRIQRNFLP